MKAVASLLVLGSLSVVLAGCGKSADKAAVQGPEGGGAPAQGMVAGAPNQGMAAGAPNQGMAAGAPAQGMVAGAPAQGMVAGAPAEGMAAGGPAPVATQGGAAAVTSLGAAPVEGGVGPMASDMLAFTSDIRSVPGLTEEQRKALDALWMAAVKEVLPRRAALGVLSAEVTGLLLEQKPDGAAVAAKVADAQKILAEIAALDFRVLVDAKALMNADQVRAFDRLRVAGAEELFAVRKGGASAGASAGARPAPAASGPSAPGVAPQGSTPMGGGAGQSAAGAPAQAGQGVGGPAVGAPVALAAGTDPGSLPPCDGRSGPCQAACAINAGGKAAKK